MRPMLARTYGPRFSQWPCYCQPKLNGIRALYQDGVFQSRDEKLWNLKVLMHLHQELNSFIPPPDRRILDGELYVHGWRLQDINAAIAVNRKEPTVATPFVQYHVFDIIDPNKSFSHRWFQFYYELKEANLPHIHAVPTALLSNAGDMQMHFNAYTAQGYEGIMLRPDGPYEYGEHLARHGQNMTSFRSTYLWKYKSWQDSEFRCIGTTQGEGKADIGIGALVLEHPQISDEWPDAPSFKVGTGLTDADRIAFTTNPPIGKLVRVRYLELTKEGIPFNPSFLAVLD